MTLKPRYTDLLTEFRIRHRSLWDSLALLNADEWQTVSLADGASAHALLTKCISDDRALIAVVRAAAVGLREPAQALPLSQAPSSSEALLDLAVETAIQLDEQLVELDNHQWQRKLQLDRTQVTVAGSVDAANARYSETEMVVDSYLSSYERLGKSGLAGWLLFVYDELMDSVAGMGDDEIMGAFWHGDWNTYKILVHAWAWNDIALAAAKRWHEPNSGSDRHLFPDHAAYNAHLLEGYPADDMIAVADGVVTTYRRTVQLFEQASDALLMGENIFPWSSRGERGSLCTMLFDVYRHALEHAQEIEEYRGR